MMTGRFHDVLLGVFELYDAFGWPPLALYRVFQSSVYDRSETSTGGSTRTNNVKLVASLLNLPILKADRYGVHNQFTYSRLRGCYNVWTGTGY
jgi:hypothetical protein